MLDDADDVAVGDEERKLELPEDVELATTMLELDGIDDEDEEDELGLASLIILPPQTFEFGFGVPTDDFM
jgi:hypothetical protein